MTYLSLPRGVLPSTLKRSIRSSMEEKSFLVEFCSSKRIFAHVDEARKDIRGQGRVARCLVCAPILDCGADALPVYNGGPR